MLFRVLLVIRRATLRRHLRKVLTLPDVMVQTVNLGGQFWERLGGLDADCIVVDKDLVPRPVDRSVATLCQLPDSPALVVLSEKEDAHERAQFLALGCDAVLNSALPSGTLCETLLAILNRMRLRTAGGLTQQRLTTQARLNDFVSHSASMQAFMNVVMRVADSDASLLIQGETGVGKERLARAIHAESTRSNGPFIAVNCGALPEALLESEMFGHEQGAFTGATRGRRGCFELAHRGTIFLDEISEMPFHLQVKLLRVLQEYEIQPVGSEKSIKISVRVMASTNRNLEEEVRLGRFRQDLYYRLSVVSLTIPPLRERREDIPTLVESYIAFLRPRIGTGAYAISHEAMESLCRYSWPGNVRELINVIERAMLLCNRREIRVEDLPESISRAAKVQQQGSPLVSAIAVSDDAARLYERPWRQVRRVLLDDLEREYLRRILASTGGRIAETARRAGMTPRSLFDKMRRHGLSKEDFKGRVACPGPIGPI
ncbi:MAG: sigma-54-dependent Fis family transcriptional regulator [Sedimentisphaerales bacterium]|nr:sigma-54-dependent Fis family transcriptional regulator [Sedimentisphaerales bacterium]